MNSIAMDYASQALYLVLVISLPPIVIASVIGIVLTRAGREDVAMLTTLSGLVVVLLMVVNMLAGFFDSVRAVFQLS